MCVWCVQKVPSHVIWKIETFIEKIQHTRNIILGQWCLTVPFKVDTLDLQFSQSPSAAPSYFPESHPWSEISSLSKVILVFGKARSHRAPNLACRGAESPGWFDVSPKHSARDVMQEWALCHDEAVNHQLSIAMTVFILLHLSTDKKNWGSTPY